MVRSFEVNRFKIWHNLVNNISSGLIWMWAKCRNSIFDDRKITDVIFCCPVWICEAIISLSGGQTSFEINTDKKVLVWCMIKSTMHWSSCCSNFYSIDICEWNFLDIQPKLSNAVWQLDFMEGLAVTICSDVSCLFCLCVCVHKILEKKLVRWFLP